VERILAKKYGAHGESTVLILLQTLPLWLTVLLIFGLVCLLLMVAVTGGRVVGCLHQWPSTQTRGHGADEVSEGSQPPAYGGSGEESGWRLLQEESEGGDTLED
jgi:hypothetical protein